MAQNANQLAQAIAKLEAQLPDLLAAISTSEAQVTDAYADTLDPSKALDAVSRAKAAHQGAVKALSELDRRLFDQMTVERDAADRKLAAQLEVDSAKFRDALPKALGGFVALLDDETVERMTARSLAIGLEALEERRYAAPLPPAPREPRPRNAHGKPKTDQELNAEWRPGAGSIWNGPVTVHPATPPRPDWVSAARV